GADKVALNSVIFENPDFLKEAVSIFGSQCIVASIDIKKDEAGNYMLYSHAHKEIKFSLEECLRLLVNSKAGEVLLNNVDLDGKLAGYDCALIKYVSSQVNIPVIAAGGASSPSDCAQAILSGAQAVAAASIFHFTGITPYNCKEEMSKAGLLVRL
ncbi:MAG TPA: HisA/HisF-related TIM barrel protein, partial [Candidatus Omnitrophota bacterium]|nr:HisA/HisF-related TIM barrel protein [Candidatus Omnitrophota bacterium]